MISEEEVRHVANLARLGLTDEEVKNMSGQLGAILESVEQIGELDLSDVQPTANALNLTNVFRPDEPGKCLKRDLSRLPPEFEDQGTAVVTIESMTEQEARALATRIFELHLRLQKNRAS